MWLFRFAKLFIKLKDWLGGLMNSLVLDKSMEFAIRIVNLYKFLTTKKQEFVMSKQLLRCGTGIGANLREAKYAQSTNDFINKNSIALKEAAEAEYWLELLYKTNFLTNEQYKSIGKDCSTLTKILTAIVKTAKQNK